MIFSSLDKKFCCNKDSTCLKGHSGPLCKACAGNLLYAIDGVGMCRLCPSGTKLIYPILRTCLIIEFLVIFSILSHIKIRRNRVFERTLRLIFNHYSNNTDHSSILLKILTNHL